MNYYKEAIAILMSDIDFKNICVELAKTNPSAFVKAAKLINPTINIDAELLELCRKNKKIAAIKLYREEKGADIKEAKNYVENLIDDDLVKSQKMATS